MFNARHLASAMLPLLLLATGCGGHAMVPGSAASIAANSAAARSVAPDDAKLFTEDNRAAQYWAEKFGGNAVLVMSIQTTALNTQKISSAANVYFSPEAYYAAKPCVLVARHYLLSALSQTTEVVDFNKVAAKLKGLPVNSGDPAPGQTTPTVTPGWTIKAPAAWGLAHTPAVAGGPKAFFTGSRANLVKLADAANPTWNIYADGKDYVIDAVTGAQQPATTQINPGDPMNEGFEVDLQRASAVWLPNNPAQPNIVAQPTASN